MDETNKKERKQKMVGRHEGTTINYVDSLAFECIKMSRSGSSIAN